MLRSAALVLTVFVAASAVTAAGGALTAAQRGSANQDGVDAAQKAGVTCRTELVPMRDGTLLATDVYLPPTPGRHAVIMQRTPYGFRLGHGCFKGTSGGVAFWAQNGYVGVTQDSRGTFRAQGAFHPIVQEQADGYDAIEWAAAQPWSDGKVGMAGGSYFGLTQWQAALTSPPHLLAIAPSQTATDYHDHWTYVNGVFDLWFGQSWLLNFFAPDAHRRELMAKSATPEQALKAANEYLVNGKQDIFAKWAWQTPLASFSEYRTVAPYYYEWLEHPDYDDYWAKVDVEAHWSSVKIPAFIDGGWTDLFQIGSVRGFQGVRAKGGSAIARAGTMLLMQAGAGHGGTGVLSFGPSVINARDLQLRFYDHYVKGIDNGIDREPPVRLAIQVPPDNGTKASSFLVSAEAFPLPGTQKTRFNLRSGGHANMQSGDGVLDASRPSDGNDDKFVYDPQKPVPSLGGGLCCISAPLGPFFGSGSQDQSSIEQREDVLVYTSARLTSDLAAIGQATVRFWARSSARDTDFTAKLVDVHPDGFAQNVLDRVVRARFRAGSKLAPALIEPGKPYQYEIDLGFAGSMFKAGHRVRLDISSSNFPHLARNSNTGNDPATDNRMEVAQQTILHNTDHPSYLELSVVPNVTIPKR